MVSAIINRFIGRLKKDSKETTDVRPSEDITSSKDSASGIDTTKIDLVNFVDFVVRSLVDHPEEVSIDTEKDERGLVMKVSCKKSEIRKIIGKNGKTINAIRSLVKGAAKRINQSVTVLVLE